MKGIVVLSLLSALPNFVASQNADYTCDVKLDYGEGGTCPKEKIGDGQCDNSLGGGDPDCVQQDCLDCNIHCMKFNADCSGCLTAVGCYWCPGDATCQNFWYPSETLKLSCTKREDLFLGGTDDPEAVCNSLDELNTWVYDMINVVPVWEKYNLTGKGIEIRINDDGVDVTNDDLKKQFSEENSCPDWSSIVPENGRGTAVAGIAVGTANNTKCALGIARHSTFSGCGVTPEDLTHKLGKIDISLITKPAPACDEANGKFVQGIALDTCPFTVEGGYQHPCDPQVCSFPIQSTNDVTGLCAGAIIQYCRKNYRNDTDACHDFNAVILRGGCDYYKETDAPMKKGIKEGRDGKGIVYVVPSGDHFYKGENTNMNAYGRSRYTISVGAVGRDGNHTDYSTPGSGLMVTAPVGDNDDVRHIMTTGLGGKCTDSGSGTAFAASVVSGVVALVLEARPELTWRDVQGILTTTSTKVEDEKDLSANTNGAGIWHSEWYGFGVINATKAVEKALTWDLWTPETSYYESGTLSAPGASFIEAYIEMGPEYEGFELEHVYVVLDMTPVSNLDDMRISLKSPNGTYSTLTAGNHPIDITEWILMTLQFWGEDPVGKWILVIDRVNPDTSVVNGIGLEIYGRWPNGTREPTGRPSGPPTAHPTEVPSETPTNQPTPGPTNQPTPAPLAPTSHPTNLPTNVPTKIPTNRPTYVTLPPIDIVRPNVLAPSPALPTVPSPVPVPSSDVPPSLFVPVPVPADPTPTTVTAGGGFPAPGGDPEQFLNRSPSPPVPVPVPFAAPPSRPLPPFLQSLVSNVKRPQTFTTMDAEAEANNIYVNFMEGLSLVLEGVDDIPKGSWQTIEIALEEHTTSVVSTIMPALHFHSRIEVIEVIPDMGGNLRRDRKRKLRPDEKEPTVTVKYNQWVSFDRLPGAQSLHVGELVTMGFETSDDRNRFVDIIRQETKNNNLNLGSLVSVSKVGLPPTVAPSASPTSEIVPTPDLSSDPPAIHRSEDNIQTQAPENAEDDSMSGLSIFGILCGVVFGIGIIGMASFSVLRRRRK